MESTKEKIECIQRKLNSEEYVKPEFFAPNHLAFRRLVCVNHITSLYLSSNHHPIPSLIKIARMGISEQPEIDGFNKFSALALEYLGLMESFINHSNAQCKIHT